MISQLELNSWYDRYDLLVCILKSNAIQQVSLLPISPIPTQHLVYIEKQRTGLGSGHMAIINIRCLVAVYFSAVIG